MTFESCPCKDCIVRGRFAIGLDMHFWGDDCPYKCDAYDNWNRLAGEQKEGSDNESCYCKNENMADCRKCYWRNICIRHNPVECSHFKKEYGD